MSTGSVQFGRVPTAVVTSGIVKCLDRYELALYLALAAHVDGVSWAAEVGNEKLRAITGMSERTVQRVAKRLIRKGLLTVQTGGGRKRCNRYTLSINPVIYGDTLSRRNPVN